jgi:hypothetical protein
MYLYCSVYSSCYAVITRRHIRCFVTDGKHVNNSKSLARQLLGKWVPLEPVSKLGISNNIKIGGLLDNVFSVRSVQSCYKEEFS